MLGELRDWHHFLGEKFNTKPLAERSWRLNLRFLACSLEGQSVRLLGHALDTGYRDKWLPWPVEDHYSIYADGLTDLLDGIDLMHGPAVLPQPVLTPIPVSRLSEEFKAQADDLQAIVKRRPPPAAPIKKSRPVVVRTVANDNDGSPEFQRERAAVNLTPTAATLADYMDSPVQALIVERLQALTLGVIADGRAQGYDPRQALAHWHDRRRAFTWPDKYQAPYHLLRGLDL